MCGIAGMHRRGDRPIPKLGRLADSLLLSIENRGRDATGCLAMLPSGKVSLQREVVPAMRFVRKRKAIRNEVRTVLLHTRFATVGDRDDVRNAHPVINGRVAAVHNGTIWNHKEIFDAFKMKRHAEVDSEVIPALIAYAGWDQAAAAIDLFEGGAAFAAVTDEHPDEVILARTEGFPLVYFVTDDFVIWASTRRALEVALVMTYGSVPAGGKWVEMPEWTMVRINGTLEVTTIRKPKPKKRAPKVTIKSYRAPRSRKRRKVGTRSTMSAYVPPTTSAYEPAYDFRATPLAHVEREPWMEDAVRDLMRIEGMDYAEAFDAVYGVSVSDDEEAWVEAMLAEGRW